MLHAQKLTAFIATKDAALARVFYEQTLGLRVISEDAFALVLDANGTMIRVQKLDTFQPHPFTALGWEVADIHMVAAQLGQVGVNFERYPGMDQDAQGVWCSPSGARVAWFKDPDGNVLSLTQR
jgi:catechol 2,3-dioxygenase-like lactoylglutathione lyase family enzyme